MRGTQADSVLTKCLFHVSWILMLFVAGFFCYFILPKMEASWKTHGMPTPVWASVLTEITHFVVVHWFAILIASAVVIWLIGRTSSRRPSE